MVFHADIPVIFDDAIPEERKAGLKIGLILLGLCEILVICGVRISNGMKGEIKTVLGQGMNIF